MAMQELVEELFQPRTVKGGCHGAFNEWQITSDAKYTSSGEMIDYQVGYFRKFYARRNTFPCFLVIRPDPVPYAEILDIPDAPEFPIKEDEVQFVDPVGVVLKGKAKSMKIPNAVICGLEGEKGNNLKPLISFPLVRHPDISPIYIPNVVGIDPYKIKEVYDANSGTEKNKIKAVALRHEAERTSMANLGGWIKEKETEFKVELPERNKAKVSILLRPTAGPTQLEIDTTFGDPKKLADLYVRKPLLILEVTVPLFNGILPWRIIKPSLEMGGLEGGGLLKDDIDRYFPVNVREATPQEEKFFTESPI